jgi:hypothetical protein
MFKKVLITGVSRGMGQAIASQLLQEKFSVVGISRTDPGINHAQFQHWKYDLQQLNAVEEISREIKELDVLINNAGIGYFRSLANLRDQEIQAMLNLNLRVPILLTKKLLPKLLKSQGHVINIGSQSSLKGEKMGTGYCATKYGLRGFSEALFAECRNHQVKVTLINPGIVKTSFFDDKDFVPEDHELCYITPEDIAQTVSDVLKMREGSVVREVSVLPQKHVLRPRKKEQE